MAAAVDTRQEKQPVSTLQGLCIGLVAIIVGGLVLASTLAVLVMASEIFDSMLVKKLIIDPNSESYSKFVTTPIPILVQFWFLNVTNAEDVLARGVTPVLDEVGPYTYYQTRKKEGIEFDDGLGTVSFREKKSYFFSAERTLPRTEDDLITTINPVFVSLVSRVHSGSLPEFVNSVSLLFLMRFGLTPFMTHPVKELLFEGYKEPLLQELYKVTGRPSYATGRFGFFYPQNNTDDGTYEIFTGSKGMDAYQNVYSYNKQKNVDFWSKDDCNMINGTTGSQFGRHMPTDLPLYLFTMSLCRSIYLEYEDDVYHGDLLLRRYILSERLLAASEDNRCYCQDDFTCRSSMVDLRSCKNGAPVVMSTPHFYTGAKEDVENVIGLNPSKEMHQTFLDIEPNTGVTFRAAKRLQLNMPLRRYLNLPVLKNVPEVILPIFWVNESALVPVERANALNQKLQVPTKVVPPVCFAIIAFSVCLIVYGVYKVVQERRRR